MADVAALWHIHAGRRPHGCELGILHGHLLSDVGMVLVDEHRALGFVSHGSMVRILAALTCT